MQPGATRRLLTADEFERMAEAGILDEDDHVELLDGELWQMAAVGNRHAGCVKSFIAVFRGYPVDWFVLSVQDPIRLTDFSQPEPDIALLRPHADNYSSRSPGPADVLLVVEVADVSLVHDRRRKLPRYAAAGIPEAWLVNLPRRSIEVHRQPQDGRYQQVMIFRTGEQISVLALPGVVVNVDDVIR
jgi:Uma2 family endonuclease